MIKALIVILFCQLCGDAIVHFSGLPVPGAVIGMILLLGGLIVRGNLPADLEHTASAFIKYIGLIFVPAGAGMILYLHFIVDQWSVILIASFISTIATLLLTSMAFLLFKKSGNIKHD